MRTLFLAFWLAIAFFPPAFAEDQPSAPAETVTYPGPGEMAPQATQLENDAIQAETQADKLKLLDDFSSRLSDLRQQLQDLQKDANAAGPLDEWFPSRLLEFKGNIEQHRGQVEKQLQTLSIRINQLTDLQQQWKEREQYWQQWQKQLAANQQKIPEEVLQKARNTIRKTLKKLEDASGPMLKAQGQLLAHQGKVLALQQQFDNALNKLKTRLFKKNSRSLFSKAFRNELKAVHWGRDERSAFALMGLDRDFLRQNLGLLITQLLIAILLGGAILKYRRKLAETSEWSFICNHPLATGIFAAVPLLSLFYEAPPPLWQLLQGVLGVFSATILVSATVINPGRRTLVYLVATIFTLSLVLKILAFPPTYYRLYLVLLALLGTPWLWWYGQRNRRARRQMTVFTAYLRLGATLMLVALFSQVSGYTSLGTLLIEATVETVIVVLFVNMTHRLVEGGIDYLFNLPLLKDRTFFQRHSNELILRVERLFKVAITGYALVYLLIVWRVFDSVTEAFTTLLDFEFTISEFSFSVQMALLVGLVLYLSLLISWLVQAVLDDHYFPRQEFDRGVRDAIKKLLHYSLVLIGFLLAASLAGIELKNFAVLAGAFGIGIGFGLQDIVNNFVSGLILLFERPVKVGDGVLIDGEYGSVIKIGMRSTVVETLDQAELIVPNSHMISQKVTNWTLSNRRVRLVVPVGVAYGSNLDLVLSILFEAGQQHPDVLKEPQPSPIFVQFGDSSLDFELRVWISNVDMRPRVKSELLLFIDKRFRETDVEIPFPQRDLHLRSIAPGSFSSTPSQEA